MLPRLSSWPGERLYEGRLSQPSQEESSANTTGHERLQTTTLQDIRKTLQRHLRIPALSCWAEERMYTSYPDETGRSVQCTKMLRSSLTLCRGFFVAASSVDEPTYVPDEHRDDWRESLGVYFPLYFQRLHLALLD